MSFLYIIKIRQEVMTTPVYLIENRIALQLWKVRKKCWECKATIFLNQYKSQMGFGSRLVILVFSIKPSFYQFRLLEMSIWNWWVRTQTNLISIGIEWLLLEYLVQIQGCRKYCVQKFLFRRKNVIFMDGKAAKICLFNY